MNEQDKDQDVDVANARLNWLDEAFRDAAPSPDFLPSFRLTARSAWALGKMQVVHRKMEDRVFAAAPLLAYVKALAKWADVPLQGILSWLGLTEQDLQSPRAELSSSYARLGAALGILDTKEFVYRLGEAIAHERGESIALLAQDANGKAQAATLNSCYEMLEHCVTGWDLETQERFTTLKQGIEQAYSQLDL